MNFRAMKVFLLPAALLAAACDRNAGDRLTDAMSEGAVPSAVADWVLYSDELRTGGSYFLIPGAGPLTLRDDDPQAGASGGRGINFSWTGADVNGQHDFAGFGLLVAPSIAQDPVTPARDLSGAGFTKITFWARGSVGENVILRVEGPGDGTGASVMPRLEISRAALSAGWAKYTLPVPFPASFSSVKQYVNFVLIFDQPTGTTFPGEGGTLHVDQISYER